MATVAAAGAASATPSTQIWIPSTDTQPAGTVHLGVDNYTTLMKKTEDGGWSSPTVYGVTAGVADTPQVGFEAGIDVREHSDFPLSLNAKIQVKEESLMRYFPAVAFGGYDWGTENEKTNFNILYGLIAKTLPVVGRASIGYYTGNDELLKDADGKADNSGVLLSWDRTLAEVDDRLWAAVDYMGGKNAYGALSFGVAWRFSPNIGALVGYDLYNDEKVGGKNTFTVQFDMDF
ncbi:MAG: hypothetical protein HQK87_02135 [Nitrospinae bacterium]|nr:hypothetical protein [Nitrospinota bacterium]